MVNKVSHKHYIAISDSSERKTLHKSVAKMKLTLGNGTAEIKNMLTERMTVERSDRWFFFCVTQC